MFKNIDLLKGIKNPTTRPYIVSFISAIIVIAGVSFLIIILNDKHNKISKDGIEVNIPPANDTNIISRTPTIEDKSINVKENNGTISIKINDKSDEKK